VPAREVRTEFSPLFNSRPVVQPPREKEEESRPDLGDLRGKILGQYRDSYILLDSPEGLRLIDQHAAHERVLFEKLMESGASRIGVQRLITPFIYEAGAAERGVLESHVEELREVGFEIEPLSGRSFAVAAVPTILRRDSLETFFRKVIDAAADDRTPHLTKVREKVIATVACHAAITVHRPLTGAEMSQVVADLLATANPYACPHGRPIIVDIRHIDIERHFHRK
jgi:DNA mismatch repair protein MutL